MSSVFLITGICGHLGSTIAHLLIEQGETVRGFALPNDDRSMLEPEIELVRGNVREKASIEPLFEGFHESDDLIVIHTAGLITISGHQEELLFSVNVDGTRNVIELCQQHRVKRLVYVSSTHAILIKSVGEIVSEASQFSPDKLESLYSKTKAMATQMVLDAERNGLNAVVVHPSGLIGPGDHGSGLSTQLVANYLNGLITACIRGGYDFVDVRDVARGVIAAARFGRRGECYLLTNRFFTALELLDMLHELTGQKKIKTLVPHWLLHLTMPFAALYFQVRKQKPLFTADSLAILTENARFSHEKADRELAYATRPMRDTLRDTITFLQLAGRLKVRSAKQVSESHNQ